MLTRSFGATDPSFDIAESSFPRVALTPSATRGRVLPPRCLGHGGVPAWNWFARRAGCSRSRRGEHNQKLAPRRYLLLSSRLSKGFGRRRSSPEREFQGRERVELAEALEDRHLSRAQLRRGVAH